MNRTFATFRNVPHEGMGNIEGILAAEGIDCTCFDCFLDPPPAFRVVDFHGLIVLGGPMNVDEVDRYPFLLREVEWVRQAIEAEKPVLGVCLGSQLIAKALGSEVYPNRVKEIGWYPVSTTSAARDDPVFRHFHETEMVFHWHGDTFDLPEGAVRLAQSESCLNQAFRYRSRVYALQFHLEVDEEMIKEWLCIPDNVDELTTVAPSVSPARIEAETRTHISRLGELARDALAAFSRL